MLGASNEPTGQAITEAQSATLFAAIVASDGHGGRRKKIFATILSQLTVSRRKSIPDYYSMELLPEVQPGFEEK